MLPETTKIEIGLEDGRDITVSFVKAEGLRALLLNTLGLQGLALPWNATWLLPEVHKDWITRSHEAIHIRQMHRDGRIRFIIWYFWQLFTKGYANIDYEVEAYSQTDWKYREQYSNWPGNVYYIPQSGVSENENHDGSSDSDAEAGKGMARKQSEE